MINCFEDIKREYVNRYSETGGILLGNSFDDFVSKVLSAEQIALNESEICDELLAESFKRNPNMTPEEWSSIKQQFMVFIFYMIMSECPQLKNEMARHLYKKIRRN